ncbi:hypothetical protein LINPERPRIM_LOCUS28733 [Linum perenne]
MDSMKGRSSLLTSCCNLV